MTIVEGWTDRLRYQLKVDGAPCDITGSVVSFAAVDHGGRQIGLVGTAGVLDAPNGIVYYEPGAEDFVASKSPYRLRCVLTNGSGKVSFYPSDAVGLPIRVSSL